MTYINTVLTKFSNFDKSNVLLSRSKYLTVISNGILEVILNSILTPPNNPIDFEDCGQVLNLNDNSKFLTFF